MLVPETPPSTAENTFSWRTWHGINYQIGGITFVAGSFLLFPFFTPLLNSAAISAWLYTIGSLTFLLADITEWLHYTKPGCPYLFVSINFLVSVTGSAFYLLGSVEFLSFVDHADNGYIFSIIGSSFIVIAQSWKEWRTLTQPGKTAS